MLLSSLRNSHDKLYKLSLASFIMGKFDSFAQAIQDRGEAERFINYAFKENPDIKNFEEFQQAFYSAFNTEQGKNTKATDDSLITLFENPYTKKMLKENVDKEEYEQSYGDGHKVERISTPKGVVTITIQKIKSKGYTRKGKTIGGYTRAKPQKWTNPEIKFLQVRKSRKISTKKIVSEFEQKFNKNNRTKISITSKLRNSRLYGKK